MAFFEGNKMTAGYGSGPDIINSCSINADRGEIVAILGPNGAGKSTAMKANNIWAINFSFGERPDEL